MTKNFTENKYIFHLGYVYIRYIYLGHLSGYDFALVVLKEEIKTSNNIKAVKLPNENAACPDGLSLELTGWGMDLVRPKRNPVTSLWSVMQKCVNVSECTIYTGPTENGLCIGDPEMPLNSGCRGDSGGSNIIKSNFVTGSLTSQVLRYQFSKTFDFVYHIL